MFCREFYSRRVYAFIVLFFWAKSALVLIFTLLECLFQLAAIRDKCGVYMEGGGGAKCIKFPLDSISFDQFFLLGIFLLENV